MNAVEPSTVTKITISRIPEEKIQYPGNIPVKVYLQEAENILNWCQQDKEILTQNGLDWSLVEDMPVRIDALREAQARWSISNSEDVGAEKEWDEKSPAARKFKRDLTRSLKFIFRRNRSAVAKINRLSTGTSHAAMIQSLRDLSVFGRENIEFLKEMKFDITLLDTSEEMSREMASLLGAVNTARSFSSDAFRLRNQAYTRLHETVKELKDHAEFVFADDPGRYRGYTSDYLRRSNTKRKNSKKQKEAEDTNL